MLSALRTRLGSSAALGSAGRTQSRSSSTAPNSVGRHDQLRMIILGAPGAGKGTQGDRLLARYPDLHSVVAGDLLRSQVRDRTQLGQQAEAVMKAGGLLPDETVLQLIAPGLLKLKADNFILDGFPRKASQAQLLDALLGDNGLNLVVQLAVPDSVILSRIEARWIHAPSNRSYNTDFPATRPKVAGKDDITGEPLTRRPDDTPEIFQRRLDAFHEENNPLLEHYRGVKVAVGPEGKEAPVLVTLAGKTSDEIWPQLVEVVEERFPQLRQSEGK